METVSSWSAPATLHLFFVRLQTDRLVGLLETPPFIFLSSSRAVSTHTETQQKFYF